MNVKRQKEDPADCRLTTDDCRLAEAAAAFPIDTRQSQIDNRLKSIWTALETVTDPEIPVLTVVDLGIIAAVHLKPEGVRIDMTPTFASCPALDLIRANIRSAVEAIGERNVTVRTVYDPPWTSDRMTEGGRRKLKEFGLAPPSSRGCGGIASLRPQPVPCPFCDSTDTEMESLFGPTLCRSIHYCRHCLQSFEHFKSP